MECHNFADYECFSDTRHHCAHTRQLHSPTVHVGALGEECSRIEKVPQLTLIALRTGWCKKEGEERTAELRRTFVDIIPDCISSGALEEHERVTSALRLLLFPRSHACTLCRAQIH